MTIQEEYSESKDVRLLLALLLLYLRVFAVLLVL